MTKAHTVVGGGAAGLVPHSGQTVGLLEDRLSVTPSVLVSEVDVGWRLTLVGTLAGLEEELWRCRICRYPSFSTFLFRVEFQWFLMELSVLRHRA